MKRLRVLLYTFVHFCSAPVLHIPSWEFPRCNLAIERVIGKGAFGVVSKAYARDLPDKPEWTTVAVKSLEGNRLVSLSYPRKLSHHLDV